MIGETEFQVTARSSGGKASIKVASFTPYGERTVSLSEEISDEKLLTAFEDIAEKAINQVKADLLKKSVYAAAQAIVVAGERGESL